MAFVYRILLFIPLKIIFLKKYDSRGDFPIQWSDGTRWYNITNSTPGTSSSSRANTHNNPHRCIICHTLTIKTQLINIPAMTVLLSFWQCCEELKRYKKVPNKINSTSLRFIFKLGLSQVQICVPGYSQITTRPLPDPYPIIRPIWTHAYQKYM